MEKTKKRGRRYTGIVLLVLCNAALIAAAVLFTVWYSRNIQQEKELSMKEAFCSNVDTMRQISERYLDEQLDNANSWKSYIEDRHMTKDEALAYIAGIENAETGEAHIVDMETYEAWTTNRQGSDNYVNIYWRAYCKEGEYAREWLRTAEKIFNGQKCVLGRYKILETGRNVIGVGTRITLREADGSDRDYLLVRAILVSHMKELWIFPTGFPTAEIGMITTKADYVVASDAMKSDNFMEFVRYYNFRDDYNGADRLLEQLKTQDSGVLELYNSKKPQQLCCWYYSRLENFDDVDILGYIPEEDLIPTVESLSIVIVVAGLTLLIGIINAVYILSINRRLRATTKEAEQASRSKTQFLSTMSHDIRTPLNAVLGMTELAQNRIGDTAYVKECLRKISVSGNHLLTLINDVLEISRVESGKININPAPFDVALMISGLESITRSQATGHGLDFEVEVGELPHAALMGDKLRLTQVYLNLLNNAVKYTRPGGKVELKVWEEDAADAEKTTLACVVRDSGVGMSPEFQKTMYESFTRVADSRTDKIQGTGLGLAIVKRMVDLMDGTIECESIPDVGTTFTVRIPLVPAVLAADASAGHPAEDAGRDLQGVRVLIAEDNELNWEIISTMLEDCGIHCTRAENGRECLDMLLSAGPGTYEAVLMDIQMPVMNGLDATRALRACGRADLRRMPIIAMTADAFAEDVQNCIDAGMNAHVAKPIEIEKVLTTLRRVLVKAKNGEKK